MDESPWQPRHRSWRERIGGFAESAREFYIGWSWRFLPWLPPLLFDWFDGWERIGLGRPPMWSTILLWTGCATIAGVQVYHQLRSEESAERRLMLHKSRRQEAAQRARLAAMERGTAEEPSVEIKAIIEQAFPDKLRLLVTNTGEYHDDFEVQVSGWYQGSTIYRRSGMPLGWRGNDNRYQSLSPGSTERAEFGTLERDFEPDAEGSDQPPPHCRLSFEAPWYYGGARWELDFWNPDDFEPKTLRVEVLVTSRSCRRPLTRYVCLHIFARPEDDPLGRTFHLRGGPAVRFTLCEAQEGEPDRRIVVDPH